MPRLLLAPSAPLGALFVLTLAGCGGGGGGGAAPVAPQPQVDGGQSTLGASAATAAATGSTEIVLTIVARDASGNPIAGQPVALVAQGVAQLRQPGQATDSDGRASGAVSSNQPGRVVVTATIGGVAVAGGVTVEFLSPQLAPALVGAARYIDGNADGLVGLGDAVVIGYSTEVTFDPNTIAPTQIDLPVVDDTFGIGAALRPGPRPEEIEIALGSGANLRARGADANLTERGSPSRLMVPGGFGVRSVSAQLSAIPGTLDLSVGWPRRETATPWAALDAMALGDLDGDRVPDLVMIAGSAIAVWRGDGLGGFAPSGGGTFAGGAAAVVVAQLDGRDRPEVVVAGANGVEVFVDNATGSLPSLLVASETVPAGDCRDVAVGDMDSDGDPDLVVAAATGLGIWTRGAQRFEPPAVQFGTDPRHVVVADLDLDGDADAVGGGPQGLTVLRVAGATVTAIQGPSFDVRDLAVADLSGGRRPELVCATAAGLRVARSSVGLAFAADRPLAAHPGEGVVVIDGDRDGRPDLFVEVNGRWRFLAQQPDGNWVANGAEVAAGPLAVRADLDRDGAEDFVTFDAGQLVVSRGSGQAARGAFGLGPRESLSVSRSFVQRLADLDGDGVTDRVVGTAAGSEVWLGDGAGGFTLRQSPVGSGSIEALAVGDIDADGDLDLAMGGPSVPLSVWFNDGTGSFLQVGVVSQQPECLALLDLDGDGDLDIAIGNDGPDAVVQSVDPAAGAYAVVGAAFSAPAAALAGKTIALLPIDADRDGDLDLLAVRENGFGQPGLDVLFEQQATPGVGVNRLAVLQQWTPPQSAFGAALVDFDGDGALDFLVQRPAGVLVRFAEPAAPGFGQRTRNIPFAAALPLSFTAADVDGNGRVDLLGSDETGALEVRLQRTDGTFTSEILQVGGRPDSLHAEDLDRDGAVDVLFVGNGGSAILRGR